MRPSALLRRLWRAQLRLRVMAGVATVMLLAIAAFDIGAGRHDAPLPARADRRACCSEVGRLGAALNGMLARIETGVLEREASQHQMRRFFADASHGLGSLA